jgi:hypothetical protein
MVSGFQRRYVAFIDILGFKNLIARMADEPKLFRTVRDTLKELQGQARTFEKYRAEVQAPRPGRVQLLPDTDLQMTAFSDCFVISEKRPAWHLLAAVQALASRYLLRSILTRGGIVRGPAYHKGPVLFGPAVIDAYILESQVASYPRILVSDDVRKACWDYHLRLCREQLFSLDVDGSWFINALSPPLSKWDALKTDRDSDTKIFLRKARKVIRDLLRSSQSDVSHRAKVGWLAHHFNVRAEMYGISPLTIASSDS